MFRSVALGAFVAVSSLTGAAHAASVFSIEITNGSYDVSENTLSGDFAYTTNLPDPNVVLDYSLSYSLSWDFAGRLPDGSASDTIPLGSTTLVDIGSFVFDAIDALDPQLDPGSTLSSGGLSLALPLGSGVDLSFDYMLDLNPGSTLLGASGSFMLSDILIAGLTPSAALSAVSHGGIVLEDLTFDASASLDAGTSPVPLPAGLPLLAASLGGLAVFRRRRAS